MPHNFLVVAFPAVLFEVSRRTIDSATRERVWQSVNEDDVFGRSAQLADYFDFTLFRGP